MELESLAIDCLILLVGRDLMNYSEKMSNLVDFVHLMIFVVKMEASSVDIGMPCSSYDLVSPYP